MSDQKEILQDIKTAVLSINPQAQVILFGSRARNTFHDESDWDILVLTKINVDYPFKKIMTGAVLEVELKHKIGVRLIIKDEMIWQDLENTDVYKNIKEDGIFA